MNLTPANGLSVSTRPIDNGKMEEGLAMAGLVDLCNDMIDAPPVLNETYDYEPEVYAPRPRLL
ncbi:hypothetical protein [Rhizobium sp. MHM7A]|uniref:hypothetical protein n=1 Tax=Rhizobium sp. MHM7A TaxID=2583233 RepID=UPI001106EDE2|nr:hypothetical protein [Rhizobium sp. MHM7A]TLX16902.1 hypothetical protein FFR93_06025 [Rhizobium sp. MHM7A]